MNPSLPRVLLLTDRSQLPLSRSLRQTVAECVDAGLTHVVLRELDLAARQRAATLAALVDVGATVISAHELLPAAAGVHLPGRHTDGAPGRTIRMTSQGLTGRSCHTRAEVEQAAAEGCDYLTLGPFAATASKPGYGPPVPPREYAAHAVPVFALGGITPANAAAAREAGAHGVAVMGAVMRSPDPGRIVRQLLDAVA